MSNSQTKLQTQPPTIVIGPILSRPKLPKYPQKSNLVNPWSKSKLTAKFNNPYWPNSSSTATNSSSSFRTQKLWKHESTHRFAKQFHQFHAMSKGLGKPKPTRRVISPTRQVHSESKKRESPTQLVELAIQIIEFFQPFGIQLIPVECKDSNSRSSFLQWSYHVKLLFLRACKTLRSLNTQN